MADDVDTTEPENVDKINDPTESAKASGDAEQRADDVEHTAVKIDEVVKKVSGDEKPQMQDSDMDEEQVIVDRTALEAILDVNSRLRDIQKKSRVSMSTLALAHESYKDKQVNKFDK
ncbi:unnamed protein product, partial [Iphiclides podalirius]